MAMRDPARWWRQTKTGTAFAAGLGLFLCLAATGYSVAPTDTMFAAMPAGLFAIAIVLPVILVAIAAWQVLRQQATDNANRVSEGD